MKRVQLIEWGIITIGLIFGFKFFEGVFTAFLQMVFGLQLSGGDIFTALFPTLLIVAIYAACFILLIRRSSRLAHYLSGNNVEEIVPLKIGKRSLLQVVLIGICLATILSNIADVLLYIFETFKREVGRRNFLEEETNNVSKYTFKIATVRTIVAVVVLYFSNDISGWFIRKNDADELTFESEPEKDK